MKINWINWALILFGIFLAYQIIRNLLGGSWGVDELSLGALLAVAGILWKMSIEFTRMNMKFDGHISWHKNHGGSI